MSDSKYLELWRRMDRVVVRWVGTGTHTGEVNGIPPTGKRVEIRYMDFWKVKDGKIVDNWVMVDFPHVMRQLGVDPFNGHGWEAYDDGTRVAPRPQK